ncbi:hypothetical protein OSB04_023384 [Centaurea solstitialis]|uniref:Uncharacterized protein n=1 Tax=Centaurea solstitialis TaxID=347529 RepID=A0AA38W282_9ASTR|nr:hypothetical protein OSB04_023384 [Centaurea solstitialis]
MVAPKAGAKVVRVLKIPTPVAKVVMLGDVDVFNAMEARMMLRLGCNGIFVSSDIFLLKDPITRARATIPVVHDYKNPVVVDLEEALVAHETTHHDDDDWLFN